MNWKFRNTFAVVLSIAILPSLLASAQETNNSKFEPLTNQDQSSQRRTGGFRIATTRGRVAGWLGGFGMAFRIQRLRGAGCTCCTNGWTG